MKMKDKIARVMVQQNSEHLAEKANRNTIVTLGDSITNQNGGSPFLYAKGYFAIANVMLGHRFKLLKNAGIAGQRTDQMLARIQTEVLYYKPRWCIVEAGVNDIAQNVSADTIIANLKSIYSILKANNINIITTTITPTTQASTASQILTHSTVNYFIRQYSRENSGVYLVDFNLAVTDASTGAYVTGYSSDGTHPTPLGAYCMAKAMYDVLKNIVPPMNLLPSCNTDSYNMLTNGMMLGNTGTGKATSWSTILGSNQTPSKVARTDINSGEWQQVVSTDSYSSMIYRDISLGSSLSVGDNVVGTLEINATNLSNLDILSLSVVARSATPADIGMATELFSNRVYGTSGTDALFLFPSLTGVLETPVYNIPVNTATLQFRIQFRGSGTFQFSRAGLYKVMS